MYSDFGILITDGNKILPVKNSIIVKMVATFESPSNADVKESLSSSKSTIPTLKIPDDSESMATVPIISTQELYTVTTPNSSVERILVNNGVIKKLIPC